MSIKSNSFAEVIKSSLHAWDAQCWQFDNQPAYGSLVVVEAPAHVLYGVVHQVYTGSDDPARSVYPYQKTPEELQREQPQVFVFLKTVFTSLVVGYQHDGALVYAYAPTAAPLHAFVRPATQQEYKLFCTQPDYLHILFGQANQLGNIDELLLAMVRSMLQQQVLDDQKLAQFIETFSLLGNNDYRRLKFFLQRVQNLGGLSLD